MCGIAGIALRHGEAAPPEVLAALDLALAHRGPDGAGQAVAAGAALVHRGLAIIDVGGGDQPLFEPGEAALIANGELYSYRELRRDLLADVAFATGSDCEPALHLYRREGLGFADRLRGMWAIAIHDRAARRVVLSRDPFGIKPLYMAETRHGLAFASEPRALLESGLVARGIDPRARRTARTAVHHRRRDDLPRHPPRAAWRDDRDRGGAHRRAPPPRRAARGRARSDRR
jgi:asparagine synthase (glutamine-hydrolysing)